MNAHAPGLPGGNAPPACPSRISKNEAETLEPTQKPSLFWSGMEAL
jgi:hypothetical protein